MNIPRGLLEFKIAKKVSDKNKEIVIYCKAGGRGCLAAFNLVRMGYKNVKNMDGGWKAWEKAGNPVE
jgi:rhodanese-related sulfurtransferase